MRFSFHEVGAMGSEPANQARERVTCLPSRRTIDLMKISEDLRQALSEYPLPLEVTDGEKTYYVVSAEQYRQMKALLDLGPMDRSFYEATEVHHFDE